MNLEQVIVHIRIEERNRLLARNQMAKQLAVKANVVEDRPREFKPKEFKPKGGAAKPKFNQQYTHPKPHGQTFKRKGNCFVCGKSGHHAHQCKHRKENDKSAKPFVNMAEADIMKELGLISNIASNNLDKCEICAEAKITKKSCKSVERESELLGLIHTDLGDLKFDMTRTGKRYYITFIDDYSRFCTVYLLRTKDEAGEMFLNFKAMAEIRPIGRLRDSGRIGEENMNLTLLITTVSNKALYTRSLHLIPLNPMAWQKGKIEPLRI